MFEQVILFAAPEFFKYTSTLLISTDAAETFTKVDLHFKYKAGTLQFNPFSDERLLLLYILSNTLIVLNTFYLFDLV